MKKLIIVIIIFTILSVVFTACMINRTISKHAEIKSDTENGTITKGDNVEIKEKTLDLYSTYNENDLIVQKSTIDEFNKKYENTIPQISGLKDKKIEEKINIDIKNRVIENVNKIAQKSDVNIRSIEYSEWNIANFANVLSINENIYYTIGKYNYTESIGLNYELVSGNRLKIDDIFVQDFSTADIVRLCMYRTIAQMENEWDYGNGYYDGEIYYNSELNVWQFVRTYETYDERTQKYNTREVVMDYVPPYNEYDIEKIVKKGINEDSFWFSSTIFYFTFKDSYNYEDIDDEGDTIYKGENGIADYYFKDIADKVVIYNKYLTPNSLFERNDIGRKDIITCSQERSAPKEKHSIFKSDNFFYDYVTLANTYNLPNDKLELNFSDTLIENVNNKMEEIINYYEEEANKNKDKAYFLFVFPFEGFVGLGFDDDDMEEFYFKTKLITCDIEEKYRLMDQLFGNIYRYPNITFYGYLLYGCISLGENGEYGNMVITNDTADFFEEYYFYDVKNGTYIEKSNQNRLQKPDLIYKSKDELNLLYNEIFARHGHDFKSRELKDYFSQFSWYKPEEGKTVSLDELSELERANASLIREVINEKQ